MFILRLISILTILFASPAWATTYYIKNGGSNAAAGTSHATAWEDTTNYILCCLVMRFTFNVEIVGVVNKLRLAGTMPRLAHTIGMIQIHLTGTRFTF
jgi:hypothetical protein